MNKKMALILVGLGFMTLSAGSYADAQRVSPIKAMGLLQVCKNPKESKVCEAYISGIADSVSYSKVYAKNQGDINAPAGFCIAPAVTGKEMREKVVVWMDQNSTKLSQSAGGAVFTALHELYPCKVENGGKK